MRNHKLIYTNLLIAFALSVLSSISHAQSSFNDTCSQLKFHSELEMEGFEILCSGQQPDYLTMAVAVNSASGTKELNKIKETVKTEGKLLKTEITTIKKPAKQLKFIFDHVQKTFLKQYDVDAGFSEMFGTGKYNCLTASILYALLLDELSIKHTIKFMPGHVYLIVYGDETPYIFETTDPIGGFVELNNAVRQNAIQSLRLMQFIASDNGKDKTNGDLFDRYYLKLNNTEIKGLVGYQYTNLAFAAMIKQDFLSAYNLITKGIMLTPIDELYLMQEAMLLRAILQADKTTVERAELLVKYYNSTKDVNKKNQISDEFQQTAYMCLFRAFPSPDSLLPVYNTLYAGIKDVDVRKVLENTYIENYLAYLRAEERPDEAFEFIYKLYDGGNKSSFIKGQMQQSINTFSNLNPFGNNTISGYDELVSKYPALMDFEIFKYNRGNAILNGAGQAFRSKDTKEGERLLEEFNKGGYFNAKSIYSCNPAWVYSQAGSCYYKMGNHSKAIASLKQGLIFDPDNYEIKKKLNELK